MTIQESDILSSIASYQTVNLIELMSMTPNISDQEVVETVESMASRKLVSICGEGNGQLVSITSHGYEQLSLQGQLTV